MLTDNEIRSAAEDTLEFNAFAETLGEIIITSEPPLTVGVYGEWGSGKTSLMRLTQEVLEKKKKIKIKTSWFNAWKYDKAHDLRVALINTILKEISEDEKTSKTLKRKAKRLLKRVNWSGLGMSALSIGATLMAPQLALIPMLTNLLKDDKASGSDLAKLIPKNILKEDGGEKTLELIGDFEEKYQNIVEDYVGEEGILVVFIDDLDRCLPEKTVDILESIKLFLHVPHSVFVIGASKEIIVNGIMRKYKVEPDDSQKKIDEWGSDYLEKIIQIPFRLPPLRTDVIADSFIEQLNVSDEIKKHKLIFARASNNPRTIKRLLNNFDLQMILAEKKGIVIEENILAKLAVIEVRWSDFHKNLIRYYSDSEGTLNLIEIAGFDETERNERLKDLQGIEQYYNDKSLMDFLGADPALYDIELDPYVFLAGATREETKEETKDASYYFNMGYASSEKGDYDKAIEYYSRAIEINPKFRNAYHNRGFAYNNKGEFDRAIQEYDKAIELDLKHYNAYNNRGVAYENKGEYDRAIEDYSQAIKLNSDVEFAYDNIVNLLNDVLEKKIHFPEKWDSSSVRKKIMSSDLEKKKKDKITALLKKLKA